MCPKCGIWGHLGKDCRNTTGSNNEDKKPAAGTFNGRCYYCNKVGHKKADCRAYKNREIANPATDNGMNKGDKLAFNAVARMPGSLNDVKTIDIDEDTGRRNFYNNFCPDWNQSN